MSEAVEKKSKVVQHPSANNTPQMTCAEAVGIAQSGQMEDCCIMWSGTDGNYHIGWSKMNNCDLAAYGVLLSHIAGSRLALEE